MSDFRQQSEPRSMFDALEDLERQHGVSARASMSPDVCAAVRARIVERMQRDALVKRLLQGRGNGRPVRITEPWMALAEQRMSALLVASDDAGVKVVGEEGNQADTTRTSLSSTLLMAQAYMWGRDVFNVVKACPMPAHVISRDLLPYPFTYHSYEVTYSADTPEYPDALTDWVLLAHTPGNVGCNVWQNLTAGGSLLVNGSGFRYGARFPDDIPEESRHYTGVVLSMLAFLNSPYSVVEQRKLPRQMRRHDASLSEEDAEQTVSVVTLRAAARDAVDAYNAESRTYKHRFWVSGHIRKQWHPSTQSHELRWIAPYLKGPTDAPMLDRVYAVVR